MSPLPKYFFLDPKPLVTIELFEKGAADHSTVRTVKSLVAGLFNFSGDATKKQFYTRIPHKA
ncbi:MAG: hypothetical protein B6D35_11960 [Candidatus Brocadia sp. UTAMX2]|jgi:hypothetical protein|nr:MAG: hypothetical protein B6D35_11960 [Candidatus Brocadia sp. UTAMX2]